jgi:hypothetical protein
MRSGPGRRSLGWAAPAATQASCAIRRWAREKTRWVGWLSRHGAGRAGPAGAWLHWRRGRQRREGKEKSSLVEKGGRRGSEKAPAPRAAEREREREADRDEASLGSATTQLTPVVVEA